MSKNPFVNCKSRKRRKIRVPSIKPKEKLFCPRTMVRYDGSHSDYPTKWICKMCLKCILSEEAVTSHLTNCSGQSNRAIPPKVTKKNEDTRYICEYCNKVFSRRVTLKKHLEQHEKSSSSLDSELSDNEVEDTPLITEHGNDDNDKPEEENPFNNIELI
ncbi:zinc finger and SCAN domain-containing protein 10-like [Metopolophium dirhodum]|uniref:zinc finger and SCAN domain-containing protein 10-like n=1 Tax=Metopolophium dirhodum TaxID=44670 RepID=UPI00298FFFF4|nr:zinc finger and SCAN domain-containing protein 10-like [Metopolophium dirhodum]